MSDDSFVVSDDDMPSVNQVKAIVSAPPAQSSSEEPDMGSLASNHEEENISPAPAVLEPAEAVVGQPEAVSEPPPEVSSKPADRPTPAKPPRSYVPIPLINSITTDSLTYDLDRMLSPKMQKKAESEEWIFRSEQSKHKARKSEDFVKMNKKTAGQRVSNYSYDEESLRKKAAKDLHRVDERFYQYQRSVQEKVRRMEEEKLQKEREVCTFAPTLVTKRRSSEGPRSADVFFQEQIRHKTYVESKVNELRDRSSKADPNVQEATFRPQLCEKSKQMLKGKGESVPAHEKLYHAHKLSMQKQMKQSEMPDESGSEASDITQDSAKPFTPAINKTSMMLVRDKPVEVALHEDAVRRANKQKTQPAASAPQQLTSSGSVALLASRFKAEFTAAWDAIDDSQSGELRYASVADLLKTLKFADASPEQTNQFEAERTLLNNLWSVMRLRDDGAISKENLETFLLAVMKFPVKESEAKSVFEVKQEEDGANAGEEKPRESVLRIGRIESGHFRLNPGDAVRIFKHFKTWYDRRIAISTRFARDAAFYQKYEHPYKPVLSKNSARMAKGRLTKLSEEGYATYEDFLLAEATEKEGRRNELLAKKEKTLKKECTFQPKIDKKSAKLALAAQEERRDNLAADYFRIAKETSINPQNKTEMLYKLAEASQMRRTRLAKSASEVEIEKNALDLTFVPDTSKTLGYEVAIPDIWFPVRGVEKAIQRMARGRRVSELKVSMRDTGLTNTGKWNLDAAVAEIPEEPMIVLVVQIGGRAQELRVRPGENLESTLKVFTAQHRLGGVEAESVHEELRRQYMQATGANIDEEV